MKTHDENEEKAAKQMGWEGGKDGLTGREKIYARIRVFFRWVGGGGGRAVGFFEEE